MSNLWRSQGYPVSIVVLLAVVFVRRPLTVLNMTFHERFKDILLTSYWRLRIYKL